MKIITVTGYKGGVGKSTTALHLAMYFSSRGRTLLVDGDPNRTAIAWAERSGDGFPFRTVDEKAAMKAVTGNDYIVIDTPARPDSSDLKDLGDGCDLLILPTSPDIVSLQPMLDTAQDLSRANSTAPYRALVTIVPPRPNREGDILRQELIEEGFPVFNSTIRRTVQISKMAKAGKTVRDSSNEQAKAVWSDFESLGREILEIIK